MRLNTVTALLLVLLLTGQGSAELTQQKPYSSENLTGFISSLIQKKEFYRASVEVRRLYHYFPAFAPVSSFAVTEEFLLLQGKQYSRVSGVSAFYRNAPGMASRIFYADSLLLAGDYSGAGKYLSRLEKNAGEQFAGIIDRRIFFNALMLGMSGSGKELSRIQKTGIPGEYRRIVQKGEEYISSRKNPYLAAGLGIIPGLGYIYAGETGTGILSFVMVSLCSTLSYLAFRYNTEAAGIFIGAIATFFYTGSIAGGYSMSKKYNAHRSDELRGSIYRELDIQNDQRFLLRKYGVKGI